ncbi:lipopolysaccharide biosynthesis protein [Aquipseudomonas campi]
MTLSTQRAALALLLGKLLRAPLWLLISALLARLLGPEGIGAWSMVLAAAMLLNQLFIHWTQVITQRYGRSEWSRSSSLDQIYSHRLPLLLLGGGCATALLVLDPLQWLNRFFGVDGDGKIAVLAALASVWLLAETQTLQQTQERYLRMAWTPVGVDGIYIAVLGSLLYVVHSSGENSSFSSVSLPLLFLMLACLWGVCWGRELMALRLHVRLRLIRREDLRLMTLFALPLVPAAVVAYLAEWIDYFLLRHFIGEQAVGLFHPAFQYVLVMLGLPTALVAVILPKLVDSVDRADAQLTEHLINVRLLQYIYAWGALTLPMAACLPPVLAWLLGSQFDQSSTLIKIMLLALPGAVVQHICMTLCLVQGRLAFSTIFLFSVKLLVNALLSAVLITWMGIEGAAIGMVVGYIVLQWMLLLDQLRYFHIRLFSALPGSLLACQLAALMLVAVDSTTLCLALSVGGMFLVLFLARAQRFVSRDEAESFFSFAGFCSPLLVWLTSRK